MEISFKEEVGCGSTRVLDRRIEYVTMTFLSLFFFPHSFRRNLGNISQSIRGNGLPLKPYFDFKATYTRLQCKAL